MGLMVESSPWDAFEEALCLPKAELHFLFRGHRSVPWQDFLLNPRRLRGSDFLMRWSQGQWSEDRLLGAVNASEDYRAIAYGPSGTAPSDPREFELYFERLEAAGLGRVKRPDLLVFRRQEYPLVESLLKDMGGLSELPFIPEEQLRPVLDRAIMAVECENSLWKATQMPDFGAQLTPQRWLGGRLGLKKTAVLPTMIIKEEDRLPLKGWQDANHLPIHVWHVFFDAAYGISLDRAEQLIREGLIQPTVQVFQAPGGAVTRKAIYKIYYHYGYPLGRAVEEPMLAADSLVDKNGHILPYVRFSGGRLVLALDAIAALRSSADARGQL